MYNFCVVCGDKLPEDNELADPCAYFDAHRVGSREGEGIFVCSDACQDEWEARLPEDRTETLADIGGTPCD